MTTARVLLSHTDALVGYKYCNGVDNNHPEDDVWIAHRWIAELSKHTEHRVLPKRLAEPINRLIEVVSDLHRSHTAAPRHRALFAFTQDIPGTATLRQLQFQLVQCLALVGSAP